MADCTCEWEPDGENHGVHAHGCPATISDDSIQVIRVEKRLARPLHSQYLAIGDSYLVPVGDVIELTKVYKPNGQWFLRTVIQGDPKQAVPVYDPISEAVDE